MRIRVKNKNVLPVLAWERPRIVAKRRAKKIPIMEWIRKRSFRDVYGYEKLIDGMREARPSLTKDKYLFRRNHRRRITRLANYRYKDHFDLNATYYFFAHPPPRSSSS